MIPHDAVSTVTDLVRTGLAVLTWLAARRAASLRATAAAERESPAAGDPNAAAESERNLRRAGVS
ncbi:MAG TPA: hypothetical protein VFJ82_16465 [Longimicrobium sp.]|nr:hypothetical protein [Longimicrobium sp.]